MKSRMLVAPLGLVLLNAGLALAQPRQPSPTSDAPALHRLDAPPSVGDAARTTPDPAAAPSQAAPAACGPSRTDLLRDDHTGSGETVWLTGSYLFTTIKKGPLPVPVLTTATGAGRGALGQPDTVVLLGNTKFDYGTFNGFRLGAGMWMDEAHVYGVEAGGFLLGKRSVASSVSSDAAGNPLLARPFFNPVKNTPDVAFVSNPGVLTGTFTTSASAQLGGLEANLVRNLAYNRSFSVELLAGFRFLDLDEDLNLIQNSQVAPAILANQTFPGTTGFALADRFATRNQFYGGQMGVRAEYRLNPIFVNLEAKVALGPNHEVVDVQGNSTLTTPGAPVSQVPGGLLALAGSNIGRSTTNWFVVVPEVGVQAGVDVTCNVRLLVGYSLLYVNNVVRPGDQLNLTVNTRFVPTNPNFGTVTGPVQPSLPFRHEDFWAQNLQFGVELSF